MGKRKYGFLTEWQRKFLKGMVKIKGSKKVSVEQRKRIEMREIRMSLMKALNDFKIVRQWMMKSREIDHAIDILTYFKKWGRGSKGRLDIPNICPKCGFSWTHHYGIVKRKGFKRPILMEGMTYGYPPED